jgi:hypothetical protein
MTPPRVQVRLVTQREFEAASPETQQDMIANPWVIEIELWTDVGRAINRPLWTHYGSSPTREDAEARAAQIRRVQRERGE